MQFGGHWCKYNAIDAQTSLPPLNVWTEWKNKQQLVSIEENCENGSKIDDYLRLKAATVIIKT